jgi:tetratricopeptide (TPR) repeat protein
VYKRNKIVIFTLGLLVFIGCSRKKDSWTSRTYHQNVSRYNAYFNGEQAMLKGLATVKTGNVDDYSKLLHAFQWGDEALRQSVIPDMDRAIEKSTKVIKTHSMEIKGRQKNKYVIMSYMQIGKARFIKGDYFPALETFNYVINNFGKTKIGKPLALESQMWAGWCQLQIGNNFSAENYFNEVYRNKDLDSKLADDVSAGLAQMYIQVKNYDEAYTKLREAILKSDVKEEKMRWIFMLGQIQEILGNKYEASTHFKKVVMMNPANYDLLFTAQLKRALNFDIYMEDSEVVYRELDKMLKDDKNIDLKDQIYYVMALIALEEENYELAEEYLTLSVETSVSNDDQKGLSFTKHAEIAFKFKAYVEAQSYYDSAFVFLKPTHEKYPEVEIRKESLTELVKNINTIETQDSLQRLSNMSLARQTQIIEDYIEFLKDEEERIAREKEMAELNNQLAAESEALGGGPNVGGSKGWYFYNSGVRASGMSTFKRRWGSRELEDNWRQKNKTAEMVAAGGGDNNDSASVSAGPGEFSPIGKEKYDVNFYLNQIPKDSADIAVSNQMILEAYVALGKIYYEKLNDPNEATKAYDKSMSLFPGNEFEPRTLYSLYRIYINEFQEEQAEVVKTKLLSTYPKSVYAILVGGAVEQEDKDEDYLLAEELYRNCYVQYEKGNYRSALSAITSAKKKLKTNPLLPKFNLLTALCHGKQQKKSQMEKELQGVITDFPGSQEAVLAQTLLDQIGGADATKAIMSKSKYKSDVKGKHRFMVLSPAVGSNMNSVRNQVADFNKKFHKFEKLQVKNSFLDAKNQILMVTNLADDIAAVKYLKSFKQDEKLMSSLPAQSTLIILSEENFKIFYAEKNLQDYLEFYTAVYKL